MPITLDLTGQTFGRLTALKFQTVPGEPRRWLCRCICGVEKMIRTSHLTTGAVVSCGCWRLEQSAARAWTMNLKHGASVGGRPTPEYRCWASIKRRCTDSNDRSYPSYGGRGIDVDPRWLGAFEPFLADVGERPTDKHSLDRIDNDRGYWPDNVRWASRVEQANNRRRAKAPKLTSQQVIAMRKMRTDGALIRELAEEFGVSLSQVSLVTLRKEWGHVP